MDLSELPSYFSKVELKNQEGEILFPVYTNGVISDDLYLFSNPDPQLIYDVKEGKYQLSYKMISLDNSAAPDYIGKVFAAEMLESESKLLDKINKVKNLKSELEASQSAYQSVVTSRRWTITTRILKFLRIGK